MGTFLFNHTSKIKYSTEAEKILFFFFLYLSIQGNCFTGKPKRGQAGKNEGRNIYLSSDID
jgi:hypothetical protein